MMLDQWGVTVFLLLPILEDLNQLQVYNPLSRSCCCFDIHLFCFQLQNLNSLEHDAIYNYIYSS